MRKMMSILMMLVFVALTGLLSGCASDVPGGTIGRIQTRDGWTPTVLKPGRHTCYGHDKLYLLQTTNKSFKETMNILVGGKINLKVDFTVRVRANVEDAEMMKKSFESVPAKYYAKTNEYSEGHWITIDQMYITFLQMKAQSIPRALFEVQPDIQTALSNSSALANEARKQITEMAKSTPLIVEDAQITNYDWPDSITKAQEELAKAQLKEATAMAEVRADLQKAKGMLQVAEAKKLVELKNAETVAESIDIIKKKLANAPEYLMWHQIRVMGEAAMGPNNAFILYPYATDASQVRTMMTNAQLSQMLQMQGVKPEPKKNPAPAEKTKE